MLISSNTDGPHSHPISFFFHSIVQTWQSLTRTNYGFERNFTLQWISAVCVFACVSENIWVRRECVIAGMQNIFLLSSLEWIQMKRHFCLFVSHQTVDAHTYIYACICAHTHIHMLMHKSVCHYPRELNDQTTYQPNSQPTNHPANQYNHSHSSIGSAFLVISAHSSLWKIVNLWVNSCGFLCWMHGYINIYIYEYIFVCSVAFRQPMLFRFYTNVFKILP